MQKKKRGKWAAREANRATREIGADSSDPNRLLDSSEKTGQSMMYE
jgi:hypothetical protein